MDNKITLKISATAAPYVSGDISTDEKMKAARGEIPLAVVDRVTLLYFLCHDLDQAVKAAALTSLRGLSESFVLLILDEQDLHPKLIDMFARLHFPKITVAEKIALHQRVEQGTLSFLREKGIIPPQSFAQEAVAESVTESEEQFDCAAEQVTETPLDDDEKDFQSKYQLLQQMAISEKIKTALTGDKEWRSLLIKDSNKLVSGAVVKNPRITEPEILAIAKSAIQNDDILRVICANKEWVKNYPIRKALIENHKTPLPIALRFICFLHEKDLAALAKNKNVSSVLVNQARRLLLKSKEKN